MFKNKNKFALNYSVFISTLNQLLSIQFLFHSYHFLYCFISFIFTWSLEVEVSVTHDGHNYKCAGIVYSLHFLVGRFAANVSALPAPSFTQNSIMPHCLHADNVSAQKLIQIGLMFAPIACDFGSLTRALQTPDSENC